MSIAVYCDLIGTAWICSVDVSNTFAQLRKKVYEETLPNSVRQETSVSQLSLYSLTDDIPFEPESTLRARLHLHLSSRTPRKVSLFSKVSRFTQKTAEPCVKLILGVPNRPLVTLRPEGAAPANNTAAPNTTRHDPPQSDSWLQESRTIDLEMMPIELFCPSFALFLSIIDSADSTDDCTPASIAALHAVFKQLLGVPSFRLSSRKVKEVAARLLQVLGLDGENTSYERDVAAQSMSLYYQIEGWSKVPIAVFKYVDGNPGEVDQRELIQTAIYECGKQWAGSDREPVHEVCCCPVFGIVMPGFRRMSVYGGMFDNQWVVQLFGRSSLSTSSVAASSHSSSSMEDALPFTRMFRALRASLAHLQTWYSSIPRRPVIRFGCDFSRLDPAPKSFVDSDGKRVGFVYLRRIEELRPNVFTVVIRDPDTHRCYIMKFAWRYGEEAHRLLADAQLAPELLYCGVPYGTSVPGYNRMRMIVMRLVGSYNPSNSHPPSPEVCAKVREAVRLLHEHNMVHGDVRYNNVMIDDCRDPRVWLIDFDWAGVEGEARYPENMAEWFRRLPWVGPGKLIRKSHDDFWLKAAFPMHAR